MALCSAAIVGYFSIYLVVHGFPRVARGQKLQGGKAFDVRKLALHLMGYIFVHREEKHFVRMGKQKWRSIAFAVSFSLSPFSQSASLFAFACQP
jgi:hypothetical protein